MNITSRDEKTIEFQVKCGVQIFKMKRTFSGVDTSSYLVYKLLGIPIFQTSLEDNSFFSRDIIPWFTLQPRLIPRYIYKIILHYSFFQAFLFGLSSLSDWTAAVLQSPVSQVTWPRDPKQVSVLYKTAILMAFNRSWSLERQLVHFRSMISSDSNGFTLYSLWNLVRITFSTADQEIWSTDWSASAICYCKIFLDIGAMYLMTGPSMFILRQVWKVHFHIRFILLKTSHEAILPRGAL